MDVAAAAATAARDADGLAVPQDLGDQLTGRRVVRLRSERHARRRVVAGGAVAVGATPVLAALGAPVGLVLVVHEVVRVDVTHEDDVATAAAIAARHRRLGWAAQWESATRWPGAAFSFVEALGAGYLGKLGGWLWPREQARDIDVRSRRAVLAGDPLRIGQRQCAARLGGERLLHMQDAAGRLARIHGDGEILLRVRGACDEQHEGGDHGEGT